MSIMCVYAYHNYDVHTVWLLLQYVKHSSETVKSAYVLNLT